MTGTTKPSDDSRFAWPILLVCCLALYVLTIFRFYNSANLQLVDSDDALRLVQVKDFLNGASWYDLRIDRLSPPEGYPSHWSRILDWVMASIVWAMEPFTGRERAELIMRATYPGLWMIPAAIATALLSHHFIRHRISAALSMFLIAGNYATLLQFRPWRIDHHAPQIALTMVTLALAGLSRGKPARAALAGLCAGLLITIGLEALPFVVLIAAAVTLRHVVNGDERNELSAFLLGLVASVIIGLLLTLQPSRWLPAVCDAIALNLVAAICAGSACLLAWLWSGKFNANVWQRLVPVGSAALLAAVVYLAIQPSCIHGPFGVIDPALKSRWLSQVEEVRPLLAFADWDEVSSHLPLALSILPVLLGGIWLIVREPRQSSLFWTVFAAFVLSTALSLSALRMTTYGAWLGVPLYGLLLGEVYRQTSAKARNIASALLLILSPVVMSTGVQAALTWFGAMPSTPQAGSETKHMSCLQTGTFDELANMAEGTVMSEFDLGPYLLVFTHHRVMSGPYHRIGNRILESFDFMTDKDAAWAQDYAKEKQINYVVLCNGAPAQYGKPSLKSALLSGNIPDWLERVSAADKPLQIFRVKD